ncbi:DNA methyltransferase [Corynebacterium choanae]|uniref:site-specific DNA-methyltransferase (adenine-specific) n=1 Tax=Corynebacterium choanae TaxID=1862358 RepID=A0A3G6J9E7_9CORY|nr:DNA methyltransferase [Corynebacterium choanae]AZA14687.1 hypothetical protein CCHOA_11580 [Corynebacterium choanae]
MPPLSLKTIEERVEALAGREEYDDDFIFELLLAYGRSKSNNTRVRSGQINVAAHPEHGEYAQKEVFYFRSLAGQPQPATTGERETNLLTEVEALRTHEIVVRHKIRFVIVHDGQWMAAVDTRTGENRLIPLAEIDKHTAFFLPWAGMEKAQYVAEAPADTKAAAEMAKLFDALVAANPDLVATDDSRHSLNIFFTRLLFCYFAEDTELFDEGLFTQSVASHTREDGSDTAEVITNIFDALDVADKKNLPAHLQPFPYVNGRLFSHEANYVVPTFDKQSRTLLLKLGRLIWRDINPDIFGSMFQAVVATGSRSELGQHYTSVPNILKTIEPLFLDELRDEFQRAYDSEKKLKKLLERIGKIKIFDPACGSGNFLVIAYKELRRLEHAILDRLSVLSRDYMTLFSDSLVKVDSFYGIEIDDFAAEVAILALWIAKHQMNMEFKEKFGAELPMIPLKSMVQVKCANATRIDWNEVCPHSPEEEVYLIGNPPYVGGRKRTKEQTMDLEIAIGDRPFSKNLDYVAAWFIKGGEYIQGSCAQLAFISTNSIVQGEHVGLMFPLLFDMGLEIGYAYPSFKWTNNAKHNPGVSVVVVGLRTMSGKPKHLFQSGVARTVKIISPYLSEETSSIISRRRNPIAEIPSMNFGMMAYDGGNLLLMSHERHLLLTSNAPGFKYLRKFYGSNEFINGIDRYAIWILEADLLDALSIPWIRDRVEATQRHRIELGTKDSLKLAEVPWRFREQHKPTNSIIVPRVSSEARTYVPMGYLGPDTVISDAAFAVYDAELWLFALLTSKMHMTWLGAVGGRMKTDYRYSNTIVYNNFPVPPLSKNMKEALTQTALRILDVREYFCEHTLAELYDPKKMPELLFEAHEENDVLVDSIYRKDGFDSDEQRLAVLFKLYEKMVADEAAAAPKKKSRKGARK